MFIEVLKSQQERQLRILKSRLNINLDAQKDDPVDYIFVVLHGIGATYPILESDYKILKYTLESIKRYWFYRQKVKVHLHITNWKKYIIDAENTYVVLLFYVYCPDYLIMFTLTL